MVVCGATTTVLCAGTAAVCGASLAGRCCDLLALCGQPCGLEEAGGALVRPACASLLETVRHSIIEIRSSTRSRANEQGLQVLKGAILRAWSACCALPRPDLCSLCLWRSIEPACFCHVTMASAACLSACQAPYRCSSSRASSSRRPSAAVAALQRSASTQQSSSSSGSSIVSAGLPRRELLLGAAAAALGAALLPRPAAASGPVPKGEWVLGWLVGRLVWEIFQRSRRRRLQNAEAYCPSGMC